MNNITKKYPELSKLLDQLCEQTLDQGGADELSRIVKRDAAARDYYIHYLEIHCCLQWDLATPAVSAETIEADSAISPTADARMKQLVDQLLGDASLESAALLSNQMQQTSPQPTPSFLSSASLRTQKGILGSGIVLLLLAAVGFWAYSQNAKQPQIAEHPVPEFKPLDKPLLDNPGSLVSENEKSVVEKLPDIHWHQNPFAQSEIPDKKKVLSPEKPVESISIGDLQDDTKTVAAINSNIKQGWVDQLVSPSPVTDDHEWVRRVYLDLAGRIPTTAEVTQFVNDKRDLRDSRLVNRLIESPEFSMHWSTRWTNTLIGRSPNERVDRLAFQQYLRNSVEESRSWSLVVADLISAEGNTHENGAANFLVAHLNNQAVPATAFVARTLLGTQVHCAQCHRHPFYATTQQQFWELNSFFKQAKVVRMPSDSQNQPGMQQVSFQLKDQPIGGPTYYETRSGLMRVAFPKFNGQVISDDKNTSRRKELAKLLVAGDDPLVAHAFVNRTWSHFFGHGFTRPVDDLGPHNPPTHPELFDRLAQSFVACDYDIKRLVRWICLSAPYRLSSHSIAENQLDAPHLGETPVFSRMYSKPLTPEQLYDSLVAVAGNFPETESQWESHLQEREQWVMQFVNSRDNDENDESNHFQGTITQALMMMNGHLVNETISPTSKLLATDLVNAPISDLEKFERICLAVLSRKPNPQEIVLFKKLSRQLRDANSPAERNQMLAHCLEDITWVYLNSSEFIINH